MMFAEAFYSTGWPKKTGSHERARMRRKTMEYSLQCCHDAFL